MRRNWQTIPLVVVVGALAGAAIAGRPTTPPNDVRISPAAVTTSTSSTLPTVTTTVALATTDAPEETDPPDTTDEAPATTDEDAPATTDDDGGSITTDDSADTTDGPPTTQAVTTTTVDGVAPESARADIRVLVANGTNRAGLAGNARDQLSALGYTQIITDDADRNFALSVIYADEANEAAALRVAEDLGFPAALVLTTPSEPATSDDLRGDVVVVLGADQT